MSKPIGQFLTHIFPAEHQWKISLLARWQVIIGPLKDRVILEKIDTDSITLRVVHSSWAHELFLLTPMLIKKVNTHLDKERIKTIRFITGISTLIAHKITKPAISTEITQQKIGFICLSTEQEQHLRKISCRELRKHLASFYQRCMHLKK